MQNPLKTDPSRTGLIRTAYEHEMLARFKRLAESVERFVINRLQIAINARYEFTHDSERVAAFAEWLDEQIEKGLLTNWGDKHIKSGYRNGLVSAYVAAHRKDLAGADSADSLAAFLRESFDTPVSKRKLEQLYSRAFESLRGLSKDAAHEVRLILTSGLADGKNPRELGRAMAYEIESMSKDRGVKIARTEVIHSHAEGQLDAFKELGIEEVGAEVEWLSTPDARRCPLCAELDGKRFTIAEARGLLPRHPNCRCSWVPAV